MFYSFIFFIFIAFFIIKVERQVSKRNYEPLNPVKVIKPEEKSDLGARVESLEKEIYKGSKFQGKDIKKSVCAEILTQDPAM